MKPGCVHHPNSCSLTVCDVNIEGTISLEIIHGIPSNVVLNTFQQS